MSDDATNVWAEVPDWGGVGARRLVRSADGPLGASLWEFQPGGFQFVYHFHHRSDELLVVLRGQPTVRLPDGDRQLNEGDVVPLPRGPAGGHQVRNESSSVARVLIVSSTTYPDVAEYPDTGKVGIDTGGTGWESHRRADAVEHAGPD
ncbi:MAG: cupin domain-containing protein [Actinobacteria bacterium]|nr:cupin domain-containing protein [Actinomycetota bacterium]